MQGYAMIVDENDNYHLILVRYLLDYHRLNISIIISDLL